MSFTGEDNFIRFGNHICIMHSVTHRILSSNEFKYDGGSKQQQVFTFNNNPNEESIWIVTLSKNNKEKSSDKVKFDMEISLKHMSTRANLHSHEIINPVYGQQEVSCYGDDDISNENDIWVVEPYNRNDEQYDEFWREKQSVVFRHVATGKFLHYHCIEDEDEEYNEVTAYKKKQDQNNAWIVNTMQI